MGTRRTGEALGDTPHVAVQGYLAHKATGVRERGGLVGGIDGLDAAREVVEVVLVLAHEPC